MLDLTIPANRSRFSAVSTRLQIQLCTTLSIALAAGGCDGLYDKDLRGQEDEVPENALGEPEEPDDQVAIQPIEAPGKFFEVDVGEDTKIVFGRVENPNAVRSDLGERAFIAGVGGASLDALDSIPGFNTAPLSHVYVGLGGEIEDSPASFKLELEDSYRNGKLTFKKGELLDLVASKKLYIEAEDSGVMKKSRWCLSYGMFSSKTHIASQVENRRHYTAENDSSGLGAYVLPNSDYREVAQVCNYDSGSSSRKDMIRAEFVWGIIHVPRDRPAKAELRWDMGTVRFNLRDGRRGYYSRKRDTFPSPKEGYIARARDAHGAKRGLRRYIAIYAGRADETGQ